MKYIIIGIDPGTTTAFAAISLDGKLLSVKGSKRYSEKILLEELRDIGKPIIIATDKAKAPSFVKRIASRLNSKLFCPDHDLGVKEKKRITSRHSFIGHKRDALAAAIFVYKFYEDLFKKIESSVPRKKRNEVKKKLLLDEAINIQDAISEKVKKKRVLKRKRKNVGEGEVSKLRKSNQILKKKLRKVEEKLKRSESRLNDVVKARRSKESSLAEDRLKTIRKISKDVRELKNKLNLLRKKNKILSIGGAPVGDEVLISGRKVILGGRKKGVISVSKDSVKILEMDGIEYAFVRDIEKAIAHKVVDSLISDYRRNR